MSALCLILISVSVSVSRVCVCVSPLRSNNLSDTNSLLKEQLSQLEQYNQCMREDLQKLSSDWTRAVEEAEQRENDYQREKEVSSLVSLLFSYLIF